MIEFYPQIKAAHILCVVLSGGLFALRGLGVLAGHRWPTAWAVKSASYAIDTALLTAALMLVTILPGALFANGWLATKLVLLLVYIGLGTFALKRGRTAGVRGACYGLALLVFAAIIGIARAHHPLGWLLPVMG